MSKAGNNANVLLFFGAMWAIWYFRHSVLRLLQLGQVGTVRLGILSLDN